jgi:hypothetical protein
MNFNDLKKKNKNNLVGRQNGNLAKLNYHIHTDAIKQNLIPKELSVAQTSIIYANEADVLNVALFGINR